MGTNSGTQRLRRAAARWLAAPVDIASLAAFRVLFGLLLAFAMARFLAKGWVAEFYVEPRFYFSYPGFGWLQPLPSAWMHVHFILLALLALGVALGVGYRVCMSLFFLGFTYVELIDQTTYLNHYYLISLLSGLMIFLPADRAWSVAAWRRPARRLDTIPAWCLNLVRFQVAVVYIFAGLAKFNADWLLRAEPLRIWLAARGDLPWVGPWLNLGWVAYAASWFGAIFDTSIVGFLLWPRTRRPAYAVIVLFHLATWALFNIGMFPWIMMAAATLLFPADWPRYWLAKLGRWAGSAKFQARIGSLIVIANPSPAPARVNRFVLAALGSYAVVQLALPLRSYFQVQPPAWTCSGFNCAWRVMIAEKTGYAEFFAFDPATGETWKLSLHDYITPRQELLMAQDPYLIREMARRLAADLKRGGFPQVQIRVRTRATLNGRPGQLLVNPELDLAAASGSGWIVPLQR